MQARYGCLRHASGGWRYLETLLDGNWRWREIEVMHGREASHVVVGSAAQFVRQGVEVPSRSSIVMGRRSSRSAEASRLA